MQPLTLSLVQSHTLWHQPEANRDLFDGLLSKLPADSQLVVLPEMFSTGFSMASADIAEPMTGPTVRWMQATASRLQKVICGSVVIEEGGKIFNRFLWVPPDGVVATYDKRHRFRMADEHQFYQAGGAKVCLTLGEWRICPMICYDLRFPVWFRNRQDYDLLICVANWPQARQDAWHTLLKARAIENQAYVAGVNILGTDGNGVAYAGGSSIYAADGMVVGEAADKATVMTHRLSGDALKDLRKSFPVWQDADDFLLTE